MFLPLVIFALCLNPHYAQDSTKTALRIYGGSEANYFQYPYIVRLEVYVKEKVFHFCTGTVITPIWILTAGHCLTYRTKLFVRYGSARPRDASAKVVRVIKSRLHISYTNKHSLRFSPNVPRLVVQNDIVLLKTEPIVIPVYGRLSALDYTSLFGQEAMACGYGNIAKNKTRAYDTLDLNEPLQFFTVLMRRCTDDDSKFSRLYPGICLAKKCDETSANTAPGDSGAPLLHKSGVVAVHSLGGSDPYVNSNLRSKMTLISPFLEWIGDTIKQENLTVQG